MSQAMYTASDDRVVTLYDTSNANPSSATFEGSTLEMDSFSVRTYFSNSGRCHRLSSWLANKWRAVLFTLILVFLIAIFGILLYDQLHKDHSSTFPDPSSSTTVKPAIGEAVEDYHLRRRLQLTTLRALRISGQVIASAATDVSDGRNCTLAMSLPTDPFFSPVVAKCLANNSNTQNTRWNLRARSHERSPFELRPELSSPAENVKVRDLCLVNLNFFNADLLTTFFCSEEHECLFTLNVESISKVGSCQQWRVYFSLHGEVIGQDECVGMENDAQHGLVFLLEPCTADKATQLFYLEGFDYSAVFAKYQKGMAEDDQEMKKEISEE